MLTLSVPVLQIKTVGYNLSEIGEMEITVRTATRVIKKTNKDIEADNDMLLVSLTDSEAGILKSQKNQSVSISIQASDLDGENVSGIKVVWTKLGSRSGSGASGGIDEEIILKIQADIFDLQNSMSIGNARVYMDYQNGKYGLNTDPNRGADTFSPFNTEGNIGDNVIFIDSLYDSPADEFSLITQVGVYVHVIESNTYWTELNIEEIIIFSDDFEKITIDVQEG